MRKHSVRKWLHAILDLLPVIILPIFAIYSHRHTIDSYEVTVSQNEVINFNQLCQTIDFTDGDSDFTFTCNSNGEIYLDGIIEGTGYIYRNVTNNFEFYDNHVYVGACDYSYTDSGFAFYVNTGYFDWNLTPVISTWSYGSNVSQAIWLQIAKGHTFDNLVLKPMFFDLTLMFGSGNEPTLEQFNTWFTDDYYPFNTGTKQLLKGVSTVTYDNSDIGSQMIYSLYKPINDYFNLNNVFNFGAIYDWFELNMFNGNAPLSIFIVWNIIVYEFIMDIIFLIYSVFMFVIDFATNTLDRFTGWAKRGD